MTGWSARPPVLTEGTTIGGTLLVPPFRAYPQIFVTVSFMTPRKAELSQ